MTVHPHCYKPHRPCLTHHIIHQQITHQRHGDAPLPSRHNHHHPHTAPGREEGDQHQDQRDARPPLQSGPLLHPLGQGRLTDPTQEASPLHPAREAHAPQADHPHLQQSPYAAPYDAQGSNTAQSEAHLYPNHHEDGAQAACYTHPRLPQDDPMPIIAAGHKTTQHGHPLNHQDQRSKQDQHPPQVQEDEDQDPQGSAYQTEHEAADCTPSHHEYA